MFIRRQIVLFCLVPLLFGSSAAAADDAEILSRRVPNQIYQAFDTFSILRRGNASWGIHLWACDPATLRITKVIGSVAPAPYAIIIRPRPNDPIEDAWGRRWPEVHLFAASFDDAVKMRRALIREINVMQRSLEKRQGNTPGYLKETVRSPKR
jgi:hypothetical protein